LFEFLGFEISDEYEDAIGWTNGKTCFRISPADAEGRKHKYRARRCWTSRQCVPFTQRD
jgi:hypothetical protein